MEWFLVISLVVAIILFYLWMSQKKGILDLKSQIKQNQKGVYNRLLVNKHGGDEIVELTNLYNELIERMNQSQLDFKQVSLAQKQMIAAISHDFRTPLTSILGYLELIDECSSIDQARKYLDIVRDRSQNLNRLIEDFYRLSLIESDDHEFLFELMDINELFRRQIGLYYQSLSEKYDRVEINLLQDRLMVFSDKNALIRIISNLIKNAIIHGKGYFKLNSKVEQDVLIFSFINGTDLNFDFDVEKLFERNFKVSQDRGLLSTGLGLYIVKALCLKLNYGIDVSLEDKVIQFNLRVPLK